jgi:hypothetical protein
MILSWHLSSCRPPWAKMQIFAREGNVLFLPIWHSLPKPIDIVRFISLVFGTQFACSKSRVNLKSDSPR